MRISMLTMLFTLMAFSTVISSWATSPSYRLGPEDAISITVLKHPELSGDFLIPPDGVLDIPGVGQVNVAGKTLADVTRYVSEQLGSTTLRKPKVSITLRTARMQRMYVLGAVAKPGVYDLKPDWRLTEALAAAGGVVGEPAECRATLLHAATGERQRVDISAVLHAAPDANLPVEPGDVLTIETTELLPVYVMGAVKLPGQYQVRAGLGAVEALAQAGGLTVSEDEVRAVVIRNGQEVGEVKLASASGDPSANIALQRNDVLKVNPLRANSIMVSGKVKVPGTYQIKDGDGIVQAITLAGGAAEEAALSRVTVTHRDGSSEIIDLTPAMQDGKPEANVALKPGDLVIVPEANARIAVLGYVNQPGYYALPDGKTLTVTDAVGLAKGIENKHGSLTKIAMLRTVSGKQERVICDLRKFFKDGDLKYNPPVQPGDVIFVPQTDKPNWDWIFQAMTSLGTMLGPLH